jgi:alpha-L-fucosidase
MIPMKIRNISLSALAALLTLISTPSFADQTDDSHMEWWRDARYGMFIHWGLYSIPGGEWKGEDYGKEAGGASAEWLMNSAQISGKEYRETFAPQFNPTEFDAKDWVSIAKAAGMKYIVITSKHHDGFCLFDTDATDYNVMDATPFKRDIIKELADECAKQDMKFGVYYSQFKDWYHRGRGKAKGTLSQKAYLELVQKNLDELLTNYGEMAVLWFDVGGSDLEEANEQGARVRKLQPNSVICSRLYSRKVPKAQQKYADFESLPDRTIASERMEGDNETCMTMRHNWGYDQDDGNWKSTKDILERFVLSAARGVNFLLNVAPTPQGSFSPEEVERLKEIGDWMKVNGESIYGTNYSPVDFDFPWGAMTQKDQTVYLHVMNWTPCQIEFNGLMGKPAKAYFLADPECQALELEYDGKGHVTRIAVPAVAPDVRDTVIALEYDAPVIVDPNAKGQYLWSKSTGVKHNNN